MQLEVIGCGRGFDVLASSWRTRWCVPAVALILSVAGCSGDLPGHGAAEQDQGWVELDTMDASSLPSARDLGVGWRTIAEQTNASRSTVPVEFSTTSNVVRVITRMGTLESPTEPGRMLANVLSESGAVPVATIRAEQLRRDTTTVDTIEVQVDPGPLQLYVVDALGVTEWSIKVQAPLSMPTRR